MAGKEWKGGSARLEPKEKEEAVEAEGLDAKVERSGWFGYWWFAIVAISLPYWHSARGVEPLGMVKCAEKLGIRTLWEITLWCCAGTLDEIHSGCSSKKVSQVTIVK